MNAFRLKATLAAVTNSKPSEFLLYTKLESAKSAAQASRQMVTEIAPGYYTVTTGKLAGKLEKAGYKVL